MPTYLESIRQALTALEDPRRHIDADIADLRRILKRHEVPSVDRDDKGARPEGKPVQRGRARTELLELMSDGKGWTAVSLAEQRGTSRNAAYAALQRMLEEDSPPIEKVGLEYRLASKDAQGSPSVASERDAREPEGGSGL